MNYNISAISIKKFLITWILWIMSFPVILIFWTSFSGIYISKTLFVIGFISVFLSGLPLSLIFSRWKPILVLKEDSLEYDNDQIKLTDIEGYFINWESPVMIEVEFKGKTRVYKITSVRFGKRGGEFKLFLKDFIAKSKRANNTIKELSFYDFHSKQYVFIKSTIYFVFAIVLLLDLIFLYLAIFKKIPLDWKLWFVNSLFIGLYFFHKKNEEK